jgi:hypothetical protein
MSVVATEMVRNAEREEYVQRKQFLADMWNIEKETERQRDRETERHRDIETKKEDKERGRRKEGKRKRDSGWRNTGMEERRDRGTCG